jgi:tetratricopeptide (TPR) repeat protein
MKRCLVFFFIFLTIAAYACLNEAHVNKSGNKSIIDFTLGDLIFYKTHNITDVESTLKLLQNEVASDDEDKIDIQNDIAVQYIKLKKYDKAEKILDELYKKNKNNYSIVVNLGTLYELQGKNRKALEFIQKAIKLNPDSHEGSEWFHLRVLEFKLKNNLTDKKINENILLLMNLKKDALSVASDIDYQLKERIPFMPAPNVLIAKILQEYGDYLADSISIKAAYLIYDLGKEYDINSYYNFSSKQDSLLPYFKKYKEDIPVLNNHYLDPIIQHVKDSPVQIASSFLDKGLNYLKEKEEEKKHKEKMRNIFFTTTFLLLLFLGGLFFWKRKKKFNAIN